MRRRASATDGVSECRGLQVNGTNHAMPSETSIALWRSRAAPGFALCLKMVATVTHRRDGQPGCDEARRELATFLARAAGLGEALGPILFQFPRSITCDLGLVRALAEVIAASPIPNARIAFEVRHRSWFAFATNGVLELLHELRWCLVEHPNTLDRSTTVDKSGDLNGKRYELEPLRGAEWPLTCDWAYVRLHGDNDEHTYTYSDGELATLATALHGYRQRAVRTYVFFLNCDQNAAMPHNARKLKQLVHALAGEPLPRAPKAAAKGIGAFFAPKRATANDEGLTDGRDGAGPERKQPRRSG